MSSYTPSFISEKTRKELIKEGIYNIELLLVNKFYIFIIELISKYGKFKLKYIKRVNTDDKRYQIIDIITNNFIWEAWYDIKISKIGIELIFDELFKRA